jgi:lipoprotein-releasing system permease protein
MLIQVFVVMAVMMGIASVLIVWVVQKQGEIGILRAMGATRGPLLGVFSLRGGLVGRGGAVLGTAGGAALACSFAGV